MFGKHSFRFIAALTVAVAVPLAAAGPVRIKLGTLAPENSPWTGALKSMGASWSKATENRVSLTVYAGTIPSESNAIARMAVDGLQAATLMVAGLAELDDAFNVFAHPVLLRVGRRVGARAAETHARARSRSSPRRSST